MESKSRGTETPTSRLLRAYHEQGDGRARERLIELHLPLVETLARRYHRRGMDQDDLVQVGSIGLINAIDRFDLKRGGELTAFAVPNIVGEIKRHLRDRGGPIRLPRPLQQLRISLARSQAELSAKLGRSPTAAELAREVGVDEAEVARALAAGETAFPLTPSGADDVAGSAGGDAAPGGPEADPDASEERILLAGAFRVLDERERRIIYLRFVRDLSRARTAQELGISPRQLSRQTQTALAKLRQELERGAWPNWPAEGWPEGPASPEGGRSREPGEATPARPEQLPRRQSPPRIPSMGTTKTPVPERYLDLPYHISVVREAERPGEAWAAHVEELAGCEARGATPDEAARRVREAMKEWIAAALADDRPVPEPRSPASHSGRLLLRMPQSLHAELARAAEREDVSLNHLITNSLASAVGWRQGGEEGVAPVAPAGEGERAASGTAGGPSRGTGPSAWLPGRRAYAAARGQTGSRWIPVAIVANTVVVALVGIVAVVLIIMAWQQAW